MLSLVRSDRDERTATYHTADLCVKPVCFPGGNVHVMHGTQFFGNAGTRVRIHGDIDQNVWVSKWCELERIKNVGWMR